MRISIANAGKVFKRNLIIISVAVILFAALFIAMYIINGSNALDKQISEIEQQNLTDTATATEYTFSQISEMCNFYAGVQLVELQFPYDEINYYHYMAMKKQIDVATSVYSPINSIYVSDEYADYRTGINNINPRLNITEKDYLGKIGNATLYEANFPDTDTFLFFKYTADDLNEVYVGIDPYHMSKQIFSDNLSQRKEFLVDKAGNIVASLKSSYIEKNIYDICGVKIDSLFGKTKEIEFDEEKSFISAKKVGVFDLYFVSVVEKGFYNNYFMQNAITNIVLSIAFLILACIIGAVILSVTYKPIRNIADEINQYAPSIDLYNKDEVKYITETTKNLYFQNKELNSDVIEKVNEIRRNQTKMLQAQICPHFICNTLDAMNWMVFRYIKERNNPLSNTIQNMSLILENNLDLSTMFTTVGEEIKVTERYVDIINVRYLNSYDVYWDIDESVLDCIIMKLCMQPLIENAASHAFPEISEKGVIRVSVKRQESDVLVSVADNGVGMSEEYLNELRETIDDFEKINSSKNIGMRNINHRLRLLYGDDYKLKIESELGKGTVCSFRIPIN